MKTFEEVQRELPRALAANSPDSDEPHVVIALPSYSVGESLLSHYADRVPSLEHRYLLSRLVVNRLPRCTVVFVASRHPGDDVLEYYASFGAAEDSTRFHVVEVPGEPSRSVAANLLDRADLMTALRDLVGDQPAVIEPWNVTEDEVEVACRLGVPINGASPALRPLGFKSEGRRLFAEGGVPVPAGVEDVTSVAEVRAAIEQIRRQRSESGAWSLHALEVNLRKGGTTHPYTTLRSLVAGHYDPMKGAWVSQDGSPRAYVATDNLIDPSWQRLRPADAIAALSTAGLTFNSARGTGVVLHMLSGLEIDGRLGLTAIAHSAEEAHVMRTATSQALAEAAERATTCR